MLGYGLGAITKPVFPLATSMTWVLMARCTERLGKGIPDAPRDAMVADITPPHLRGAAYGLRQALDSAGACVGPLLAVIFMLLLSGDIKAVLWLAAFPAFIAVSLLVIFVREPEGTVPLSPHHTVFTVRNLERLGQRYWLVTQGLFSKLVADTSPADLRGTAFGAFNVVTGGSVLLASVIAGALWSAYGPAATFLAGAAFASIAAIGILTYRAQPSHS